MNLKLNKGDKEILSLIAGYKVITVNQLTALTGRSRQGVRRCIRSFIREDLIVTRIRD